MSWAIFWRSAIMSSIGMVRGTVTRTPVKSVAPAGRMRRRASARTPSVRLDDPADVLSGAARRRIEQRVEGAFAEPQGGRHHDRGNDQGGDRIGGRIAEPGGAEPDEHRERTPHVGGKIEGIGRQRLARSRLGDPVQGARAEKVDDDRSDDDRRRPPGEQDLGRPREKAVDGFIGDPAGGAEKQARSRPARRCSRTWHGHSDAARPGAGRPCARRRR